MIVGGFEVFLSAALGVFHAAAGGSVVGISAEDVLVLRDGGVVVADLDGAVAKQEPRVNFAHVVYMIGRQCRRPAIRIVQLFQHRCGGSVCWHVLLRLVEQLACVIEFSLLRPFLRHHHAAIGELELGEVQPVFCLW